MKFRRLLPGLLALLPLAGSAQDAAPTFNPFLELLSKARKQPQPPAAEPQKPAPTAPAVVVPAPQPAAPIKQPVVRPEAARHEIPKPASVATSAPVAQGDAAETASNLPSARGVKVRKPPEISDVAASSVSLRFDNVDVYELIQAVMGDMLHLNYLVDPSVQGKITLNTSGAVSQADLLSIFESVLAAHNLSLVRDGKLYKIVRDPMVPRDSVGFEAAGENSPVIQVVPVRFVQAAALVNMLKNFVSPQASITNDATNRYLVVADRAANVAKILDLVKTLDVDYLKHVRIRMLQIEKGDAAEMAREMDALFKTSGLFNWPGTEGNKIFFMPIVRMNALLVAAANEELLDAAQRWVKVLDDEPKDGVGANIHVYRIVNSNTLHIANILRQIYGGAAIMPAGTDPSRVVVRGAQPAAAPTSSAAPAGLSGTVQIIPDESTSSLVIRANQQDYLQIKKVIQQLDVVSRQVLIQVMVAEVTLTDDLAYGIEWYLKNVPLSYNGTSRPGAASLFTGVAPPARNPLASGVATGSKMGFNYSVFNSAGDVVGLFNILSTTTDVNLLSAPHLLASDGKTAKIEVGSEEPIITQTLATPTTATGALSTSNSVTYRPTGILLEVKPSINPSGLITLNVSQEVSARGSDVLAGGSTYPSFDKRKVNTDVTLEDGKTLMIAGLIQDKGNKSSSGIPLLKDIPVIGALFGSQGNKTNKTELMISITPYIVNSKAEGERITSEFQESLKDLKKLIRNGSVPALKADKPARADAAVVQD